MSTARDDTLTRAECQAVSGNLRRVDQESGTFCAESTVANHDEMSVLPALTAFAQQNALVYSVDGR
jgi:hypothetical protein